MLFMFVYSFLSSGLFRWQYFSMSNYCVCFDVEEEECDGRDKKYIICIQPVGSTSLIVGAAGRMGIANGRVNPM